MNRKEVIENYNLTEKELCGYLLGALIYDEETDKGTHPFSIERIEQLEDTDIQALNTYFMIDDTPDTDLNNNKISCESFLVLFNETVKREELKETQT